MRTFLYSTETVKQKYGSKITASVYKLTKNKPFWLGDVVMFSQSMRGIEGEINSWLIENKYIPRTGRKKAGM